jgi:hypothetical protein
LTALLGEPGTTQVLNLLRFALTKQTATGVLEVIRSGVPVHLQTHLFATGGKWALQFEHDDGTYQENHLAQLQLQFQQTLLEFDSDSDLIQYLNERVALITFKRSHG